MLLSLGVVTLYGVTPREKWVAVAVISKRRPNIQATAEYRFPIVAIIGGALFVDFGTTIGSQGDVPGQPGIVRGLPGTGLGYGLGVRVQSPVGQIRVDYGFNVDGGSRLHFGIGERF